MILLAVVPISGSLRKMCWLFRLCVDGKNLRCSLLLGRKLVGKRRPLRLGHCFPLVCRATSWTRVIRPASLPVPVVCANGTVVVLVHTERT